MIQFWPRNEPGTQCLYGQGVQTQNKSSQDAGAWVWGGSPKPGLTPEVTLEVTHTAHEAAACQAHVP